MGDGDGGEGGGDLLDRVLAASGSGGPTDQAGEARAVARRLAATLKSALTEGGTVSAESFLDEALALLDRLLSAQAGALLRAPDVQALEARWRGLAHLVDAVPPGGAVRVAVLDVSAPELRADVTGRDDLGDSASFHHLHDRPFVHGSGDPVGLVLVDTELGVGPADLAFLESLALIAATASAVVVAPAAPSLLGTGRFDELEGERGLHKRFEGPSHARWRSFRDSAESAHVGLVLPRALVRAPYGPQELGEDEAEAASGCWVPAVWLLAGRVAASFAERGWSDAVAGAEAGRVPDLPRPLLRRSADERFARRSLDADLAEQARELHAAGLIPLVASGDAVAFPAAPSCNEPASYEQEWASTNARLLADLPFTLGTCRILQALRIQHQRALAGTRDAASAASGLRSWLGSLVGPPAVAGDDARRPLAEAEVEVAPTPDGPAPLQAEVSLLFHGAATRPIQVVLDLG